MESETLLTSFFKIEGIHFIPISHASMKFKLFAALGQQLLIY